MATFPALSVVVTHTVVSCVELDDDEVVVAVVSALLNRVGSFVGVLPAAKAIDIGRNALSRSESWTILASAVCCWFFFMFLCGEGEG